MLVVYFICWGSWLSSKLILWWAGDTELPFTQTFYIFSILAQHLPAVHATINPAIYWSVTNMQKTHQPALPQKCNNQNSYKNSQKHATDNNS
jgi:hypothetical protein